MVLAQQVEDSVGEDAAGFSAVGADPRVAVHAVHDVIGLRAAVLGAVPVQQGQRIGIGDRQGAQQDRIHEAVDGGVGADAEGEREDGEGGEGAVMEHGAEAVAQVLRELFEQRPAPYGAGAFLTER